MAVLLLLKAQS